MIDNPTLRELIEAETAAALAANDALNALQEEEAAATRRIAPTLAAEGERFTALMRAALFADHAVLAARARHIDACEAHGRAHGAAVAARADLEERAILASERQAAAFEAAEARQRRFDETAAGWGDQAIAERRIAPPAAST